ncbi:MAG: hypothetical protein JJT81_16275 [Rubellimicrobium sp.]|nr:hypothetical protein [Rubellimicrobium sp.]
MANGVIYRIGADGLIQSHPRRRAPRFPLQGLAILFAAAFLFKGFLYASLTPVVYDERVALLEQGTIVERAGAWMMQPDPATVWLGAMLAPLLR